MLSPVCRQILAKNQIVPREKEDVIAIEQVQ